jgi:TrmH family RNA methyltransferase
MKFAEEIIRSKQNRIVVDTAKLLDRKAREKAKLFRFDGVKLFEEAVQKGVSVKRILLCESRLEALSATLESYDKLLENIPVSVLSEDVFSKISDEQSPEGIVCVAEFPENYCRADESGFRKCAADKSVRIMALESVRDPGNIGTIIRSAAAFGIDALAISRDCADVFNPKTVRGAMGALFKMKIFVFDDLVDAINVLKSSGRRVYAAALDKNAVRLDEAEFESFDTAVIGNEGHGLSEKAINACTQSLFIPMEEGSESLNAAIAASVIMWSMYARK